ncbi:hypothetical protein CONPUDRAFT_162224 [Coniophora puteana RWD-64-598 SS2]|uniref:Mitochondrial carrier n=1 Tax=Coniophora puteana (strain RWD-64-598) TaxID=741705 RepID=A0A5M3N0F9_CONPW|nr:uncharacterized protein CONPUDRAFT_162224 [Coniophora puteana RWD-64-598 SS2]EIW84903.1 hypothetical protein CONPUDRAFT_162224 [Coniophora puteana RWD-64-598 SS2]
MNLTYTTSSGTQVAISADPLSVQSELILTILLYPIISILTRWRVEYCPKQGRETVLPLNTIPAKEDTATPDVQIVVDPTAGKSSCDTEPATGTPYKSRQSFFEMAGRVWTHERWNGLYKGLPLLLVSQALSGWLRCRNVDLAEVLMTEQMNLSWGVGLSFFTSIFGRLAWWIPQTILLTRLIVSPETVPFPFFKPRSLMTPTELAFADGHGWIAMFVPGLGQILTPVLTSIFTFWQLAFLLTGVFRRYLLLSIFPRIDNVFLSLGVVFFALVGGALLDTVLLTPLEVAACRLAVRADPFFAKDIVGQALKDHPETRDALERLENEAASRAYVRLRQVRYDHLRLRHFSTIISEEGWGALYTGWWWTFWRSLVTY